ncbi:type II toxin-antitoxin system HicB family antitoxin [Streptomyces sp. NPDC058394]|uniref:type II toxin-antitoxin system HicB family antitoxin n=1 Tax=Streptomyces sp. NPDC058394 TaxID=3346477 RepID=UPI0036681FC9
MTVYRVTARRSGDWWALEVPDLPGVFSQAKRLESTEEAAREAIAVMLDCETDDIHVTIEPVLPDRVAKAVADAEAARKSADEAAAKAQAAMQAAATELTESLSQRDAGRVLGVSFQRISQLLKAQIEAASPEATGPSRAQQALRKAHVANLPKTKDASGRERSVRRKEKERV